MVKTIVEKEVANYEWIDIAEPTSEDLTFIKERFNLNEASIKDSKEPEHLPKIEEFENYTFIILRVMSDNFKENSDSIGEVTDRLTIFFGADFIITVHKRRIEFLEKLKNIEFTSNKTKNSRKLAVFITTAAVFTFSKTLDQLSTRIDSYEELIFLKRMKQQPVLKNLYFIKRQIDVARKVIFLYKEVIEHFHSSSKKDVYTRDLKDLQIRTSTLYENLSENVAQLLNVFFNISSNHTNEIMRILTIFSVFFMPITFVAGIYGMNFKNMPELEWYYGYPVALGIMVGISLAIYFWFKRKGWL